MSAGGRELRKIGLDREGHRRKAVELKTGLTLDALDRAVTAHAAHLDRGEAIQAVADLLPSGAPAREVEATADAFLASEVLIRIGERGQRRALHYAAHAPPWGCPSPQI